MSPFGGALSQAFSPEYTADCERRGYWTGRILLDHVIDHSGRAPAKVAVVDGTGRYRYDELVDETLAVAQALYEVGVAPGDTVMVVLPPIRQFVPVFLAVERVGAIVTNVMPTMGRRELEIIIGLARPKAIFTVASLGRHRPLSLITEVIEALPPDQSSTTIVVDIHDGGASTVAKDTLAYGDLAKSGRASRRELPAPPPGTALANLTFTTGSTGTPKGVLHTHNTSIAAVRSTAERQALGEDDVFHAALPVGHTFGYFYGVRMGLLVGGRVVMQLRWDPKEMAELSERERLTHSAGTPTYLADIVGLGEPLAKKTLASMKVYTCAGARLDTSLGRRAMTLMPGRLSSAYGMSEAGHVASTGEGAATAKILGTVGSAHSESKIWIDEASGSMAPGQGEVVIAGPSVFPGYLQGPDLTVSVVEREGTYRTGDIGYLDTDGYLVLTGRMKTVVVRGGEKVPAGEVEGILRRCPGISDVAVVGVPDPRLGERCVAVIEEQDGANLSLTKVSGFLEGEGVTRAFWPEDTVIVRHMPRNDVGKWVRAELAELAAARLGIPQRERGEL